jgi:hypothetical protein
MRRRAIVVSTLALPLGVAAGSSVATPGDFCDRKPGHPRCQTVSTTVPPTTTSVSTEIRANLWIVP